MSTPSNHLAIIGATIIDGNGGKPIENGTVLVEGKRITAVGDRDLPVPSQAKTISANGKFVIPGLLDANVHVLCDIRIEILARHLDHYEDLAIEAAQLALKGGLTTLFDTWGPRRYLMKARDAIDSGTAVGARLFCAGNIVGFDGPYSADFNPKAVEVASAAFVNRVNAIWVENVGRHLMWLQPLDVAKEVGIYIKKGIDFVKYGSNDHFPGAFLAFSPETQKAIVDETHKAGLTAQAHTMSVEGLRLAVEAGCDLIQHANSTAGKPIPASTLELMAKRQTGAVIFPFTQHRLKVFMEKAAPSYRMMAEYHNENAVNLMRAGVPLLAAWDAWVQSDDAAKDPLWGWLHGGEDNPQILGQGHIAWFKAMEELGCPPMTMLQAATRNIALAYGKSEEIGTLGAGKFADLIILDKDPLESFANYRSIHMILKEGAIVDREALPTKRYLSGPSEPPAEEEASYIEFIRAGRFPMCPMCGLR